MKLKTIATVYGVEVERDQFIALLEYENIWHGGLDGLNSSLDEKLLHAGCYDVEYNRHYPDTVWFTISKDDDSAEFHAEIVEIIKSQLAIAVEWMKDKE